MRCPVFLHLKNSVLVKWIASYLLILTVPIILGVVLLKNAHSLLVNEYKEMHAAAQQEVSRRLDDYIAEVANFSSLLSQNPAINAFILQPDTGLPEMQWELLDIAKQFQSYSSLAGSHSCYLYLNNIDAVVTTSSVIQRELLGQKAFRNDPFCSVDLDQYIYSYHANSIHILEMPDGQQPRLMLVKSLPSGMYDTPRATLFQILGEDVLPNLLDSISYDVFAYVALLSESGEIIANNSTSSLELFPEAEKLVGNSGQLDCSLSGEEYVVFYSRIPALDGFWCVMMVSEKSIQEKTGPLQQSSLLFIALSIGAGSVLMLFLLRQNYRPVRRILHEITPYSEAPSRDAFEQISTTFRSVVNANLEWDRLWKQQAQFLQERFLESVFLGNVADTPVTREILSSFSITFTEEYFCVLLLVPTDSSSGKDQQVLEQFRKDLSEYQPDILLYSAKIGGIRTVLANLKGDAYDDLCSECRLFAEDRHFLWVTSWMCGSLNAVSSCYQEAMEYLHKKQLAYENNQPFPLEPTFLQTDPADFGITTQLEEQFLQLIQLGDIRGAAECFRKGWVDKGLDTTRGLRYQSFLYGIANAVWKTARDLPGGSSPFSIEMHRQTDAFLSAGSFQKASEELERLLFLLHSARNPADQEETEQPLIREIIRCVDAHYSEVDFNATRLADYLGKNLSYLSKLFKNTTGVGLHDYINRIRINRGKQLLSERHLSITEVARQVGFENLNSFIRVFKKFEATTPGSYRPPDDSL